MIGEFLGVERLPIEVAETDDGYEAVGVVCMAWAALIVFEPGAAPGLDPVASMVPMTPIGG